MSLLLTIFVMIIVYLGIGLGMGALVSNLVYKQDGSQPDAYSLGIVAGLLWPLACVVITTGAIWFGIVRPILTPKAVRQKRKDEYLKRQEEAIAKGIDPKSVSKHFVPPYAD